MDFNAFAKDKNIEKEYSEMTDLTIELQNKCDNFIQDAMQAYIATRIVFDKQNISVA